jgi:hypothetical protein
VDAGDWPGVGALFARGRLVTDDGTELAAGADAVAAFYTRGTQLHDGSPRTKHLVTNTVLAEPAADGTVEARSSYLVLQGVGDRPLQPLIAGRYVDRFAHDPAGAGDPAGTDGGWYFVERAFAVDLVGDLSDHLRFSL